MSKKLRVLAIVLATVIILAGLGYGLCTVRVKTGFTAVVTTFGKVEDTTLEAGFHFKGPAQRVIQMDNRVQKKNFEMLTFSKDTQETKVVGSINFNINKTSAMTLFREVGVEYYDTLILPRLLENINIAFSKRSAGNLITDMDNLAKEISKEVTEDLSDYGINVINISLSDIDFTDQYTNAVEAKQVAEQDKLRKQTEEQTLTVQAKEEAERRKIAADTEEYEAQKRADAEAYQISTKAEAEAGANEKLTKSISDELTQYKLVQLWNGMLPNIWVSGESNTLPLLPLGDLE